MTLVEQYPPGHVRAASGGESPAAPVLARTGRLVHAIGEARARALAGARARVRRRALRPERRRVVLRRVRGLGRGERARAEAEHGLPIERLAPDEGSAALPQLRPDRACDSISYEPEAGVLRARDATRTLAEQAIERGARFVEGVAAPEGDAVLVDGERLEGDHVVWAGGAWLARLFPDLVQLTVTRQDVYFFGAPAGWQAPSRPRLGRLRRRRLRRRRRSTGAVSRSRPTSTAPSSTRTPTTASSRPRRSSRPASTSPTSVPRARRQRRSSGPARAPTR